jgi:S1-C subfamily serine protease
MPDLYPTIIILQVDVKDVNTFDELISVRDEGRVGQTLQFKIMRDGEIKTIPVQIKEENIMN